RECFQTALAGSQETRKRQSHFTHTCAPAFGPFLGFLVSGLIRIETPALKKLHNAFGRGGRLIEKAAVGRLACRRQEYLARNDSRFSPSTGPRPLGLSDAQPRPPWRDRRLPLATRTRHYAPARCI